MPRRAGSHRVKEVDVTRLLKIIIGLALVPPALIGLWIAMYLLLAAIAPERAAEVLR